MSEDRKLEPFAEIPESFKGLKDEGVYYVDKTAFIPFLIEQKRKICVFTRPRRFGKTLMLRTLQAFFEYVVDAEGKPVDNLHYFEGLNVMNAGVNVLKEMGQYPVISLSFKNVWGDTYEKTVSMLNDAVCKACVSHGRLLMTSGKLSDVHRAWLQTYMDGNASDDNLQKFLGMYTQWLKDVTNRETVILIDEYDVPLQKAAIHDMHHPGDGLFDKTVSLIGQFISSGYKSNDNLAYGIIAGCMRVAKESIFTGMNNPGVIDVTTMLPDEFWGFTEADVRKMLAYYNIEEEYPEIERWYDGYNFGGRKVFNPWSLLSAIRGLVNGEGDGAIQVYWGTTSGNDIIDDVIERNPQHREIIEKLMNGETITAIIYKNLSYRDLKKNPDTIWSFLLYTGYLKALRVYKNEYDLLEAEVTIPNTEVKTLIRTSLQNWWKNIKLSKYDANTLVHALIRGDAASAERELRIVLNDSTSVFDYNEAFYHGMLVGLLGNIAIVRSNDEYGEGRPDIVAIAENFGIILEVKCVTPNALKKAGIKDKNSDRAKIKAMMAEKLDEAIQQIHDNGYREAVLDDEPLAREVLSYAVCFCRKWCVIRAVEEKM